MSFLYKTYEIFCRQVFIETWDIVKLWWRGRDEKGKLHKAATTEYQFNWKRGCEKKLDSRKKFKQEEIASSTPSPHNSTLWMVSACYCSLDWLREGSWCHQLNNNLTGRNAVRKMRTEGEIKNKRKTHRNRLPHATGDEGMVVACTCFLIDWGRVAAQPTK